MATNDGVHTSKFAFDGKDQRKMQLQTLSVNKDVEDNENAFWDGCLSVTLLVTLPGNTYLSPQYRCWGGCHTHLWSQYRCWGGCHRSLFLPLPSRPQHSRRWSFCFPSLSVNDSENKFTFQSKLIYVKNILKEFFFRQMVRTILWSGWDMSPMFWSWSEGDHWRQNRKSVCITASRILWLSQNTGLFILPIEILVELVDSIFCSASAFTIVMVCFHCPTPIPIPIIVPIPIVCRSAPLGPIPMQKLQWKLVKLHLISTDVGAKMGTVPIGIGIGACIGIGVGSVETVLHITIEANSIKSVSESV